MTENNRVLIVSPYPASAGNAVATGFEVYSIVDPSRETDEHLAAVARHSRETHHADFTDGAALRRLVATIATRADVATVLAMGRWEDSHLPAAEVAWSMGLGLNPPEAVRCLDDKAAMRRLLSDAGLGVVSSAVFDSPDAAGAAFGRFELPVIAKPANLWGSSCVRLIEEAADLASWRADLADRGYAGRVIVEEFLRGSEFSVETFSADGEHHVIGITAKRVTPPPGFVETGHLHPAPLPEAQRAAIADEVTGLLRAAGYRFGPAHTEVMLTGAGPRIIESQARLGGDRIPLLVELASGFDLDATVFHALAGKPVETPIADRVGGVSYFQLPPGVLRSVNGLADIERLPFVYEVHFPFEAGDTLPAFVDTFTRHGHFVLDAGSEHEAESRIARVHQLLRADLDPTGGD